MSFTGVEGREIGYCCICACFFSADTEYGYCSKIELNFQKWSGKAG